MENNQGNQPQNGYQQPINNPYQQQYPNYQYQQPQGQPQYYQKPNYYQQQGQYPQYQQSPYGGNPYSYGRSRVTPVLVIIGVIVAFCLIVYAIIPITNNKISSSRYKNINLDQTFIYENFEITVYSDYDIIDNYDDYFYDLGYDDFAVAYAVTIKNVGDESDYLSSYDVRVFDTQGLQLDMLSNYSANNHLCNYEYMRPNAQKELYIFFEYEEDGEYILEFGDYNEKYEIVLPVYTY